MHGYEVHEALYQAYEIHGPWLVIRKRERGQFDHIMTMYGIGVISRFFSKNVKFYHNFEVRHKSNAYSF